VIGRTTEEQRDSLTEIVNIGMGQAGDSLARLLNTFIRLSVPRVRFVSPSEVVAAASSLIEPGGPVIAARQAFSSQMRGEAIVVYDAPAFDAVTELVDYLGESRDEMILEISNLLIGSCLRGIAAQFSRTLSFSPPSILCRSGTLDEALAIDTAPWSEALIAEVSFRLENRPFSAHLLIFWPDDAIDALHAAVDRILEGL
jgi:chemotaxis protein CheC